RNYRAIPTLSITWYCATSRSTSSLDRKISRAANEGGATYGTDQIDRARTCLARRDRLRHCQHRRHCRAPEVQRSLRQHDDIDGINNDFTGRNPIGGGFQSRSERLFVFLLQTLKRPLARRSGSI